MKFLALSLSLFIGLVSVHVSQAKVTSKEAVGTVIDGAKSLTNVINKLNRDILQPISEQIAREINQINTNIDGLSSADKKYLVDARAKLSAGQASVVATRNLLSNLADQTVTLAGQLKTGLDAVIKGASNKQAKVEALAAKMKELLTKSNTILKQAEAKYREAGQKLNDVTVDLGEFSKRITDLASSSSSRYRNHVADMRKKVYGGSAACMIFPPSCIAVYAAAAAALETQINSWKSSLNSLLSKCRSTKSRTDSTKSSVKKNIESLATEEGLVRTWESKVATVYDEVKHGDYVDTAVLMEELLAEGRHVGQLDDLINACKAFKSKNANVGV